jgi:hypothetical protein
MATPPTTPPAIAPTLEELPSVAGPGESEDEADPGAVGNLDLDRAVASPSAMVVEASTEDGLDEVSAVQSLADV